VAEGYESDVRCKQDTADIVFRRHASVIASVIGSKNDVNVTALSRAWRHICAERARRATGRWESSPREREE
jgi:hypothetical protein